MEIYPFMLLEAGSGKSVCQQSLAPSEALLASLLASWSLRGMAVKPVVIGCSRVSASSSSCLLNEYYSDVELVSTSMTSFQHNLDLQKSESCVPQKVMLS